MSEFYLRTEEIKPDEIQSLFVETPDDRAIIDELKSITPVVLIGSRGVGKSLLLRMAEQELLRSFEAKRILPVYVSFTGGTLLQSSDRMQFQHWMLARLSTHIVRRLRKLGLVPTHPPGFSVLTGDSSGAAGTSEMRIEKIARSYEESWQNPGNAVDLTGLPNVDNFKCAIEDICEHLKLDRITIFFDEAAHIFFPEQQRQFFTLFRDLRSPHINCNAAVYPGVTAYGSTFQPIHDAAMRPLNRNIFTPDYVSKMRQIVEKQADSQLMANIARNGENFAVLAYAATGNPRLLLKSIQRAPSMNSSEINTVIREFYRTELWAEHSLLSDKYGGHRALIDWGRTFIENDVLPEIHKKNTQYIATEKSTSCYFWVNRDAPETVKEALRLLSYTGIVAEHADGMKATRSEIGTRYTVNLGAIFSLEAKPASSAFQIAKCLTPKRMSEFGPNHSSYSSLLAAVPSFDESTTNAVLNVQLIKNIRVLEITDWQKSKLRELGLTTLGDVLRSTETELQEAKHVGEKRSRRMRNAALAAVYEYLSG